MDEKNSQKDVYVMCYDGKETNPPIKIVFDGFCSSLLMDLDDLLHEWHSKSQGFDLEKLSFKKI